MKTSMLLFILFFIGFNLFGQAIPGTFKIYRVEVIGINSSINTKGALYAINDSSILISNNFLQENYNTGNYEVSPPIPVYFIKTLWVKGENDVVKSALIGLGAGALTGIIIGFAAGDDEPCGWYCPQFSAGTKAAAAGVGLAIVGVSLGVIIGRSGQKFTINGSQDNYHKYQNKLIKRSIVAE